MTSTINALHLRPTIPARLGRPLDRPPRPVGWADPLRARGDHDGCRERSLAACVALVPLTTAAIGGINQWVYVSGPPLSRVAAPRPPTSARSTLVTAGATKRG